MAQLERAANQTVFSCTVSGSPRQSSVGRDRFAISPSARSWLQRPAPRPVVVESGGPSDHAAQTQPAAGMMSPGVRDREADRARPLSAQVGVQRLVANARRSRAWASGSWCPRIWASSDRHQVRPSNSARCVPLMTGGTGRVWSGRGSDSTAVPSFRAKSSGFGIWRLSSMPRTADIVRRDGQVLLDEEWAPGRHTSSRRVSLVREEQARFCPGRTTWAPGPAPRWPAEHRARAWLTGRRFARRRAR